MNSVAHTSHSDELTIAGLRRRYAEGSLMPSQCIGEVIDRIERAARPEVWISRVDFSELQSRAAALDELLRRDGAQALARYPLLGIPFAVKDNIDVAGMPTTAACPAFAYTPQRSATVVEKLLDAGAILIGKANLDQFATGLVGTRSPYGAVRNAVSPAHVSGGSSSGSAVAVALGMVAFSLGTDTAGSGRVPAALNGIVGLKPSRGLFSARGVVPACRTLDCVSIFAHDVAEAWAVAHAIAGYDTEDAWSRHIPMLGMRQRGYRIAIPAAPEFFGDSNAERAWLATVDAIRSLPDCAVAEIDFAPFRDAAQLLYQGPWVAERLAAIEAFHVEHRAEMNDVVGGIIDQGAAYTAVDAFKAQYRLAELRRQADMQMADHDFLLVPSAPTMPLIADVERDPVRLNSQLGYYTNFVNFFDMAALAVPAMSREDGLPFGVTLIGRCGADHLLAAAAQRLLPQWGSTSTGEAIAGLPLHGDELMVKLAVVGAHLEGQPLNWQLRERGARKLASTTTAACYRLYALAGTVPPKPGLERAEPDADGQAIKVEVWELPMRRFGEFVAEVPAPLAIGNLELAGGEWVKGFVCEPCGLAGATDITAHGGWVAYLASRK
jgi:allophanate hydrolase